LLKDEYEQVEAEENWTVAVYFNSESKIVHSVKRENGIIYNKFDGYQLIKCNSLSELDLTRYGTGNFNFYINSKIIEKT